MRRTITLDDAAAALVQKAMRERRLSLNEVVNEAIIRGLAPQQRATIDLPSHSYGPALMNLDKASQIAGELEDEEIMRKMSQGR